MDRGDNASSGQSGVAVDPRHVETLSAREPGDLGNACRRSRPTGEGPGRTARMNLSEESDSGIVLMNHSNHEAGPTAESGKGRPLIKENIPQPHTHPTQSGARVSQGLAVCGKPRRNTRR
jgi:hypothetical protein